MKRHNVLILLVIFQIIPVNVFCQNVSSHIEHYTVGDGFYLKAVINAYKNTPPSDTLWTDLGEGGWPFKIHKTNSIEIGNGILRNEYEYDYNYGTQGSFNAYVSDSSYHFSTQNFNPLDSTYFNFAEIVNLFFVDQNSSVLFNDYHVKHVTNGGYLKLNPIADINLFPLFPLPFDDPGLLFELNEYPNMPMYEVPDAMTIHPHTGEIRWQIPDTASGMYELLIKIKKDVIYGTTTYKRLVFNVSDTIPDEIVYTGLDDWEIDSAGYYEYHISPNENLQLQFTVNHPFADSLNVFSHSEVYLSPDGASYSNSFESDALSTTFEWTPNESHLRTTPYVVHFVPSFRYNGYWYYDFISVSIFVNQPVGVDESNPTNRFEIYPNPTTSHLTLTGQSLLPGTVITVYNLAGQQVYGQELSQAISELVLDARQFGPVGIYVLHVQPPGQAPEVKKVVVQE